jgi:two-component system, NtrC family, response regulator AtoC
MISAPDCARGVQVVQAPHKLYGCCTNKCGGIRGTLFAMPGGLDGDETRSILAADPRRLESPRLVAVWDGGSATCSIPERGKLVIGRAPSCGLQIGTAAVSREHAVVHAGSPPRIEDLGSANGTWLDGHQLERGQTAPFSPGCVIQLGDALIVLQAAMLPTAPLAASAGSSGSEALAESGIERLGRLIDLVASSTLPVILHGETGAGKEVTAERIHAQSSRAKAPYLKINCAAFAESMVESELFGHERGAFTGATQAKVGLFEAARGGSVLLDEVTELSLPIQAKLLRALGNREVMRVGATKPTPIDVRFIAATNQDFASLVAAGRFRADLYFRLNGITLEIPPLRERRSEILPLALELSAAAAAVLERRPPGFTQAAQNWLLDYDWPGNVRELKNVVERATLLAQGGAIDRQHLQADALSRPGAGAVPLVAPAAGSVPVRLEPPSAGTGQELRQELREIERERVVAAMSQAGGNQTLAARLLGISRRALITRLDSFKLPRPRKGQDSG